jgi:hypothetical protein
LPEQSFGSDIAILDVRKERWLNPRGLRLSDRLGQLGLRADHGIELFPDLAGDRSRPAGADLAEQQKYKRPEALTKDQMRQMLAEAVRNTQPELNPVQKTDKSTPKRRSRKA